MGAGKNGFASGILRTYHQHQENKTQNVQTRKGVKSEQGGKRMKGSRKVTFKPTRDYGGNVKSAAAGKQGTIPQTR